MFSGRLLCPTRYLAIGLALVGLVLAGCGRRQAPAVQSAAPAPTFAVTGPVPARITGLPQSPLAAPTTAGLSESPVGTPVPAGLAESPVVTPTGAPVEVAPGMAPLGTPATLFQQPGTPGTAVAQTLADPALGFSLAYPSGFTVERPNSAEVILTGPHAGGDSARLFLEVTPANGRTAAQVADALVADVKAAMPGYAVQRSGIRTGGQDAVELDRMPGQDINRQVVVVHSDRLYTLTFIPADPGAGQAYQQMDDLFRVVLASLTFLPSK